MSRSTAQFRRRLEPLLAPLLFLLIAPSARPAAGQPDDHAAEHPLGRVHFAISCNAAAQARFDRAVALLHHMTYPVARGEFRRAAEADPRCAMAHWGVAMTLFQPLWPTRPSPGQLRQGWEEVEKARALAPPTDRERLFIAAAEAFFRDPDSPDYWLRIRRWEQTMREVHEAFPDDDEAAAFFALARIATAPADSVSRDHQDEAAKLLLRIYAHNPDHPGAMHYLVHADDVPGRERESLEIVRKYETIAPDNPHALHMPTHIYTRLGDWDRVIQGNLRAADAALKSPAGERGDLVWDEFPHALEYLIYAELQKGDDAAARAGLERLVATSRLEPTFKTAFHLSSTQARYALERRAWEEAAGLSARRPPSLDWDRYAWPEAVTRFARGLGAAHLGRLADAEAETARLAALEAASRKAGEELFARQIEMLRLELAAWLDHARAREEDSLARMRQAAELEVTTPKPAVTPAPTLPARELLGDLLMEQRRPAEALAAYREALRLYPRRFNGLLGAARAARAAGDDSTARDYYRELLDVAGSGDRRSALEEAAAFAARRTG
jgi:tetratricopeptide (TPR) repeat protein